MEIKLYHPPKGPPSVEMMQYVILWSDPAHFSRAPCIKLIKFGQDLIKLDGNDQHFFKLVSNYLNGSNNQVFFEL